MQVVATNIVEVALLNSIRGQLGTLVHTPMIQLNGKSNCGNSLVKGTKKPMLSFLVIYQLLMLLVKVDIPKTLLNIPIANKIQLQLVQVEMICLYVRVDNPCLVLAQQ
jgi:hypothetical protein